MSRIEILELFVAQQDDKINKLLERIDELEKNEERKLEKRNKFVKAVELLKETKWNSI